MLETAAALLFLIGGLWLVWQLFALVGDMAERRGQDRLLWQVVALFINPISAMILLWMFCSVEDTGDQ
ncbi:hypothetical protein [uncultured Roseovarius sp.]|uniref:hypothetical protein n=2 Tax=Roseovarius TaxID=74030 RepID=UPI0025D6D9E9|nr:hypothetical protein [uncultured Roseovarius sp.]